MHKDGIITLRVSNENKNKIKNLAEANGISMTRYLLLRGLGQELIPGIIPEIKSITKELNAWGNNLNQITKLLNEKNLTGSPRLTRRTKQQIKEIKHQLNKQLEQLNIYIEN